MSVGLFRKTPTYNIKGQTLLSFKRYAILAHLSYIFSLYLSTFKQFAFVIDVISSTLSTLLQENSKNKIEVAWTKFIEDESGFSVQDMQYAICNMQKQISLVTQLR